MSRTHWMSLGLILLATGTAIAGVPDPRFSVVDPAMICSPSHPDTFHVLVRNGYNAPRAGRVVTFDFSSSAIRLMTTQAPGITVDCAARSLGAVTDASGRIRLVPRFGGFENREVILVSENRVVLRQVSARSTHLDAQGGWGGVSDFAQFAQLLLERSTTHPEGDLNDSRGVIDLADLAIMAADVMTEGTPSYCP